MTPSPVVHEPVPQEGEGRPRPYYEYAGITIYHGDLRDVVPSLGAVADVVVADPTYNQTSLDWDRWVPGWAAVMLGSLRSPGSMWCFGTLRMFMDRAADFGGWRLAQDVIWEKHNGSSFHADRFKRVHEQVAHFYPKSTPWAGVFKAPQYTMDATKRVMRRKARPNHTGKHRRCGVHIGGRWATAAAERDFGPVLPWPGAESDAEARRHRLPLPPLLRAPRRLGALPVHGERDGPGDGQGARLPRDRDRHPGERVRERRPPARARGSSAGLMTRPATWPGLTPN